MPNIQFIFRKIKLMVHQLLQRNFIFTSLALFIIFMYYSFLQQN